LKQSIVSQRYGVFEPQTFIACSRRPKGHPSLQLNFKWSEELWRAGAGQSTHKEQAVVRSPGELPNNMAGEEQSTKVSCHDNAGTCELEHMTDVSDEAAKENHISHPQEVAGTCKEPCTHSKCKPIFAAHVYRLKESMCMNCD
jgi:hypothetical protein